MRSFSTGVAVEQEEAALELGDELVALGTVVLRPVGLVDDGEVEGAGEKALALALAAGECYGGDDDLVALEVGLGVALKSGSSVPPVATPNLS